MASSIRFSACSKDCSMPPLTWNCGDYRNCSAVSNPVACAPQAWASATPFTLLEASLGLQFDPAAGEIRLINPSLPMFLDWVILRNLQLNESSVDLRLHRHDDKVSLEILHRRGQVQVSIV